MLTKPSLNIEELLSKRRDDHILTMDVMKDICKRIKVLEKKTKILEKKIKKKGGEDGRSS